MSLRTTSDLPNFVANDYLLHRRTRWRSRKGSLSLFVFLSVAFADNIVADDDVLSLDANKKDDDDEKKRRDEQNLKLNEARFTKEGRRTRKFSEFHG